MQIRVNSWLSNFYEFWILKYSSNENLLIIYLPDPGNLVPNIVEKVELDNHPCTIGFLNLVFEAYSSSKCIGFVSPANDANFKT